MNDQPRGLDRLFHEVRRRGLLHAAGVYAVFCWFVVQLLATLASFLGLSDLLVRGAITVTFAGLPLVLAAAWLAGGSAEPEDAAPAGPAGPPRASEGRATPTQSAGSRSFAGLPRARTVLVVVLAFFGGALWAYRQFGMASAGDAVRASAPDPAVLAGLSPRAVAVLPFDNASGDPDEEYFSQGVGEEIRTALARVPDLRVASRTSSYGYAESGRGLAEIAAALGVGSVLEGSVQRADERLRVTVRLVDARSDRQLWSETYDRRLDLDGIFAVEAEIARSVARALEVELGGGVGTRLVSRAPLSLEAHDLYLLGLFHWNRRTAEDLRRAGELFRAAAERDPEYALAHAGLANTYVLLPLYARVRPGEAMPAARDAALRALALDSTLAEAHAALAFVRTTYDWDWSAAEAGFRRAIDFNPSYATAREWYAVLLDALGRHVEAGAQLDRALALDPLSLIINTVAGAHHVFAGEYERAAIRLERALELQPGFPLGLEFLAQAHLLAGRGAEAEETLGRWAEATGAAAGPWAAVVEAAVGARGLEDPMAAAEREAAVRALEGFRRSDVLSPYRLAQYHALIGAEEQALRALETAVREKDFLLFWVNVHPAFEELRDRPRFRRVVEEMGLAAATGGDR